MVKYNLDLSGKTIVVTGSSGFIGSNLCLKLMEEWPDAKIIGIDNGCPECHELWKETRNRTAFNGLAYCVIRAGKTAGEVKLTVEGEGLTSAQLVFEQQ